VASITRSRPRKRSRCSAERGTRHQAFWPCHVSVLDATIMDRSRQHHPRHVTDAYLLALAVAHGGHFVTFDRSLSVAVVRGATEDHLTVL